MKIVYTCITGNYDILTHINKQAGWRYLCFTDNPNLRSEVWEIIHIKFVPKIYRKIKLMPHLFLPKHDVSIWVDGNIELLWNLDTLAQRGTFTTMAHPDRNNIYSEAQACIKLKKDKPDVINAQMATYRKDGYNGTGLIGSGVIVRHNTPENKAFGEAWWKEVEKWSVRDQLSFNYVADKLKLRYTTIEFLEKCRYTPHSPKGEVMQRQRFDSAQRDNTPPPLGVGPSQEGMEMDIIILSNAKTEALYRVTCKAIETLLASEAPPRPTGTPPNAGAENFKFNVLVIEQTEREYEGAETWQITGPFNYNKFLNIGLTHGRAKYVAMCNNDLIFHPGWASGIIAAMEEHELLSASPLCPVAHKTQRDLKAVNKGYQVYYRLCGWCIVVNRSILEQIGKLDEGFPFWCADDCYAEQLKKHSIEHGLIRDSRVTHLGSITLKTLPTLEKNKLTLNEQVRYKRERIT